MNAEAKVRKATVEVLAKGEAPGDLEADRKAVAAGFWPKLRKVAGKLPFAPELAAAWYCAQDPATPFRAKAVLFGALAYFIAPVDALPDLLPGLGFTDDAAVLAAVIGVIGAHLKERHKAMGRRFFGIDEPDQAA